MLRRSITLSSVLLVAACVGSGKIQPQGLASVTSGPNVHQDEAPRDAESTELVDGPHAELRVDEPQLSEDEARAQLQASCEARCGTVVDREAIIRRVVAVSTMPSQTSETLAESHGVGGREPTDDEKQRFMSFVRGGPATIVRYGREIHFNPERVELDGRFGSAIFIDEGNHVVACIASDPDLVPFAVRVDC